jgi:7-keto-8-aminopelargonate synthetase-like enzyme
MSQKSIIETVNQIASHAKKNGIAHLDTQDKSLTQNVITLNNKETVNFGSCSYLGLEFNENVREAAKSAIDSYGTQFSSSRAYVSPIYYSQLEEKLTQIFNAPTIVTPTTTLGHIAAIPTLVSNQDAVILDHQVHNSVQTATAIVKSRNTHVELVRHNRMDLLEQRIIKLKEKHEKVWYMADGIYSMYGDATPLDEVYALMDKYPEFHFYVDDAHGMSCFGKNGRGYVLADREIHPQMVVATSFAKAFATGGGALIFPTQEMAQLVRNVGGPMITSGPMQPSALGAANAVADIHLSDKIKEYQEDLQENIRYTNMMLKKYNLPNLAESFSPIFFIAVSLPKVAYDIINRLKEDGFFLNIGIFPAVPIKNTGVRFTITRLHTFEQIENMVKAMAKHYPIVLKEHGITKNDIYKAFKMTPPEEKEAAVKVKQFVNQSLLNMETFDTIEKIDQQEWNAHLGDKGTFDWNGLSLLEKSFSNNDLAHQNWIFDYVIIRDNTKKIVLATFLTTALSKDDMLMDKEISYEVEMVRINNPTYMTSQTLSVGSPLTEGNHIYVDNNSPLAQEAWDLLLQKVSTLQEERNITNTIIRDLPKNNENLDNYMIDNGLFKTAMPENCKITDLNWKDEDTFFKGLSKNSKRHFRKNVTRNEHYFNVEIKSNLEANEMQLYYELYVNTKNNSLALNTFKLPFKLFKNIAKDENWEIVSLSLKPEFDDRADKKPVAMALCHKGNANYTFVIAGLDYDFNEEFSSYRQLLWRIVERAGSLAYNNVNMGYTSTIEKRRFGAKIVETCGYMQVKDNYSLEALGAMSTSKTSEYGVNKRRVLPI